MQRNAKEDFVKYWCMTKPQNILIIFLHNLFL